MPKINDLQKQKTIILHCPAGIVDEVQRYAKERQMTISAFLRKLISQNVGDIIDLQFNPVVSDSVDHWPVKQQRRLTQ